MQLNAGNLDPPYPLPPLSRLGRTPVHRDLYRRLLAIGRRGMGRHLGVGAGALAQDAARAIEFGRATERVDILFHIGQHGVEPAG